MTRWGVLTVSAAVLAAACSANGAGTETTTSTLAPSTTTTTTVAPDTPDCLAGELPFAETGIAAALDSPQHDAVTIGGIRWQPEETCERVILQFLAEGGSPATRLGAVGVTVSPDSRLVRVSLPDVVTTSAIGDSLLDGSLAHRVYVVEGIDEGLVVDIHLAQPTAARAFTANSPSRLVIDLRPIGEAEPAPPINASAGVVVSTPRSGPELYPLRVAGYAAPGVDSVTITLRDQVGAVALSRSVATVSDRQVWRSFVLNLSDGPSGQATLEVAPTGDAESVVSVELDLP